RHYAVLHQHDRHVVAALLQVNRQLVLSGRSCIRKWILTLNKQKVGHWGFSPGFATAGPPADQADLTAGSQARCPATACGRDSHQNVRSPAAVPQSVATVARGC